MSKPSRTVVVLASASLVLGLAGWGAAAVADDGPRADPAPKGHVAGDGPWAERPADDEDSDGTSGQGYPVGRVLARVELNVRSKPFVRAPVVGSVRSGSRIELVCKNYGDEVDGNDLWYRLAGSTSRWVSARYVQNLAPVKLCPPR
ncbi:SH3 domain-containing protein [Streptomyces sp. NPDC093225]|uniref:SH3 domain-containing protein n=1 Tax=Streptomyces sp. NPDC093225 TaxID=3366034 RepID=UPI0038071ED7